MIVRGFSKEEYESFHAYLRKNGYAEPLDASFLVTLSINGEEYVVKVQPERNNKMAVLQALRRYRTANGAQVELITQNKVLHALLEITLYQGAA